MMQSTFKPLWRERGPRARLLLLAAIISLGQTACGGGGSGGGTSTSTPTVNISVAPTSIAAGGSATLTWSSTNATSCNASGSWIGTQPTSGTQSTGVMATAGSFTYTLTCTGAGGTGSNSANLTVTAVTATGPTVWVPDFDDQLVRVYIGSVASQPQPIVFALNASLLIPANTSTCNPNSVAVNAGSVYVVCSSGFGGADQILVYQESAITSAAPGAVPLMPTPTQVISNDPNFNGLIGSAFDSTGDLFVASYGNSEVLEFTAGMLAGGQPVSDAVLTTSPNQPAGLTFDTNGSLWITGSDPNSLPVALNFVTAMFNTQNPSPDYCITSDTEANAQPCDIYAGANGTAFSDLEGIAIFNGNLWIASNGGGAPGFYVYGFTESPGVNPQVMGHLINATYLGSPANGPFQCPGGLFATATHLWVNDEGVGDPGGSCGAQAADQVTNGSGAGAVFYLTAAQILAGEGGQVVDPAATTTYVTGRPGFGGIYVENDD